MELRCTFISEICEALMNISVIFDDRPKSSNLKASLMDQKVLV